MGNLNPRILAFAGSLRKGSLNKKAVAAMAKRLVEVLRKLRQ